MDVDVQPTESLASLLQTSQGYTKKSKPGKLKPETLDIQRLRDANHLSPAKVFTRHDLTCSTCTDI